MLLLRKPIRASQITVTSAAALAFEPMPTLLTVLVLSIEISFLVKMMNF